MSGCWAKGTPAVAVEEGCVWITSLLAAPAISRSVPRLALVERPTTLAVPLRKRLPPAKGVPAMGRKRTFCQVKVLVTLLTELTVKVSCVEVTEVMATEVPLPTALIFCELLPPTILPVGATPPVSNVQPLGTFKLMVPTPTLALMASEYTGPVRLVNAPPTVSAEIPLPPVAGVNWARVTVMDGLVLGLLPPSTTSVAVRVKLPLVLKKTIKACVPFVSGEFAGRLALLVEEVSPTMSVALAERFQLVSTALTVTLNALEAIWASGAPLFPVGVPGAAVSPGTSNCSFAKRAGLTVTLEEIALLKLPLLKTIVIVSATA